MKTTKEIMAKLTEIAPNLKSSEVCMIAGLCLDQYSDGYKESSEKVLKMMEDARK